MVKENSLASSIALLPERDREKAIASLSQKEAEALIFDWEFFARPKQLPPSWDWYIWLLLSGRGGGKTRAGAELVIKWAKEGYSPIALIGATAADVRDTMVEVGDSSILKISPPWFMPVYEPSKRHLTWPNGVVAITYSGDAPDQLRGMSHQKAWPDELAKYKYPQDTWDNLMFGLRIGDKPQAVVTTTPRPIKVIKELVADKRTAVTLGHTLENKDNLAPDYLRYIMRKYEGTRLGRQELAGEILDDNPNALWTRENIDADRMTKAPELKRIVVAIDPQGTEGDDNSDTADTGIIVAGVAMVGSVPHAYILADLTINGSPDTWARAAVTGYHLHKADRIVAEVNYGGDMVGATIKTVDKSIPFRAVYASRGKAIRAEPVSALYEQHRVHHIGFFPYLEDQLCLAEGTLVATANGEKPIQELNIGELVWTRRGLRPVEGLRCNGVKDTLLMGSALGYNIRATGNHPFHHENRGWMVASELAVGDKILCLTQLSDRIRNLMGASISFEKMDIMGGACIPAQNYYTELFGSQLMGRSLKALIYITRMKTKLITPSAILNCDRGMSIGGIMQKTTCMESPYSHLSREVSRCGNNGRPEREYSSSVKVAERSLSDAQLMGNSAPKIATSDTIVKIQKADPVRVWDLQVAAEHEYFAGGFLVHNCEWVPGMKSPDRLDGLVWAIYDLILADEGKEFMIG